MINRWIRKARRKIALSLFQMSNFEHLPDYYLYVGKTLPIGLSHEIKQMVLALIQSESVNPSERYPRQLFDSKMWFLLDLSVYGQNRAFLDGVWYETGLNTLIAERLQEGDTFADIGANIGIYSLYASHYVGETGHVYSIEANPNNYQLLQGHIALNLVKNIETIHTALGEATGTIILHNCTEGSGLSTGRESNYSTNDDCEVPLHRGDELLSNIHITATGICKIDVEGMEYEVVAGLEKFIETHKKLIYVIEVNPLWIKEMGHTPTDLHNIFLRYGYEHFKLSEDGSLFRLEQVPAHEMQYLAVFMTN